MVKLTKVIIGLGVFLVAGLMISATAAAASDTEALQPTSSAGGPASATKIGDLGSYFDEYNSYMQLNTALHSSETMHLPDVHIGSQGSGGVTFFNGTIVNETTTADGADIPVTFGDGVRIDGPIWRGESRGTSDDMPVKFADSIDPLLTNINNIGSPPFKWQDIYYNGTLHGGGAQFGNDVSVAGGVDITNDLTVDGNGIIGQNLSVTGDIAVGGLVDGINVSDEIAVWYDASASGGIVVPGDNPKGSKVVTGRIERVTAAAYGDNTIVELPTGVFANANTYTVTATYEFDVAPDNGPDSFYPIVVRKVDGDTFYLYAAHTVDGSATQYNISYQAVGYTE